MGYNVEVAFDLAKHNNVTELKQEISSWALNYQCDHYYYYYDMENQDKTNKVSKRNHCIVIANFDDEETFNCAKFIKIVKSINGLHIECIYEDSQVCKLIYASQCYLKNIDKDKVIVYNKFKRERSHSDNEKILLEVMAKKQKASC